MAATGSARILREDPITNRFISDSCWNGHHEQNEVPGDLCKVCRCGCMCHDYSPWDAREQQ